MGLAWFDDEETAAEEAALRVGGLPLLPADARWPECPRCELPMLFRAQVPLALTSLVAFDDDRYLHLFECHAWGESGPCDGALAMVVGGELAPREAPEPRVCDVILRSLGSREAEVMRIVDAVDGWQSGRRMKLPRVILPSAPPSIARETVRAIRELDGNAETRPSPPTRLGRAVGGRVVPFEDGAPGARRTTLPPLDDLVGEMRRTTMRGLFGGTTPGYRDHSFICDCGKPTRTALRLLADRTPSPSGIRLGPAVAQVCLRCSVASLHRVPPSPVRGEAARV